MNNEFFSETVLNLFTYIKDNRKKLVERYHNNYGSNKLNTRVFKRRNISNQMKTVINKLIVELRANCPIETGNAKLNGIRYRVLNKNSAVVTVGYPSAPYVVILNTKGGKYRKGGNAGKSLSGWIEDAVYKSEMEILSIYDNVELETDDEGDTFVININIIEEEEEE